MTDLENINLTLNNLDNKVEKVIKGYDKNFRLKTYYRIVIFLIFIPLLLFGIFYIVKPSFVLKKEKQEIDNKKMILNICICTLVINIILSFVL